MNGNKRTFYRLNTLVPMSYRILSNEDAQKITLPSEPNNRFIENHFLHNLQKLDQQLQQAIEAIGEKSDLLASALHALNNKVNLTLQSIDKRQLAHMLPLQRVNLSAGGMAFELDEPVNETDRIDILMQPLPDEAPVLLRGHIVNIQPMPEKGPNHKRVAIEFENTSEDARRKLIYFIQKKELEQAQIEREKKKKDI